MPKRGGHLSTIIVIVAGVAVLGAAIASAIIVPGGKESPPFGKIAATPAPVAAAYFVAPHGKGNCVTSPCGSLDSAVAKAKANHTPDAIIELAAGDYPGQTIHEAQHSADAGVSVVVRAARGARVTFPSLIIEASHLTIHHVTVTGPLRLATPAVGSGVDDIRTDGGSVFLGASNSFVENSTITPSVDADGIQIKAYEGHNPQGIRIEHNVVGPTHRGPARTHVDCIQILGGSDIVIRYNTLFHCADQGIIAGSGATGTISGTLDIERNAVQLCPQHTSDCDGFDAINLRAPKVIFVHNTVVDGGAVFKVADLTVAANYFDNLKTCGGTIEGNLLGATQCHALPSSNHRGKLQFVAPDAQPPDLTPLKPVLLPGAKDWIGGAYAPAQGEASDGASVGAAA